MSVQANIQTAVYVIPVGKRQASHWMYWRAEPMMMIANGVMIGHHCRSFQSVQKSQSPANSCLVMSAAAPTTKAAVIQKTASHLRSIHRYCLSLSARSSSVLESTATANLPSSTRPPGRVRPGGTCAMPEEPWRLLGDLFRGLPSLGLDLALDLEQADQRLGPEGEDAGRQPAVEHERPVERDGEDLLGDPEAVPPLVHGDLGHLGDRGGDQEEERPREALLGPVHLGQPVAAVQVGADREGDAEGEEQEEHRDVGRGQGGVP